MTEREMRTLALQLDREVCVLIMEMGLDGRQAKFMERILERVEETMVMRPTAKGVHPPQGEQAWLQRHDSDGPDELAPEHMSSAEQACGALSPPSPQASKGDGCAQ